MLKAISPAERTFLEDGVTQNMRNDGRSLLDFRNFYIETGTISQTNGSARLKLQNTDVLVGVKLETGEPDSQTPDQGKIHVSVECCTSASPEFEGRGSEFLNNELARYLERIIKSSHSFDLKQLSIIPGKLCWILYVDAMVLDSGGNLFDAISIATRAALHNTAIPQVEVNMELGEFELVEDPDAFTRLNIENVPICITFTKIGPNYVVDANLEEELCMSVRLTVAVNKKGNICGIQKGGHGGLEPSSMYEMLSSARKVGQQILDKIDSNLKSKSDSNKPKTGFLS